jgi:hypothetical protein
MRVRNEVSKPVKAIVVTEIRVPAERAARAKETVERNLHSARNWPEIVIWAGLRDLHWRHYCHVDHGRLGAYGLNPAPKPTDRVLVGHANDNAVPHLVHIHLSYGKISE